MKRAVKVGRGKFRGRIFHAVRPGSPHGFGKFGPFMLQLAGNGLKVGGNGGAILTQENTVFIATGQMAGIFVIKQDFLKCRKALKGGAGL